MFFKKRKIISEHGKFYKYTFDKKQKYLLVEKTPESSFMHEQEYKNEILLWLKINRKYRPEKILIDNSLTEFIITPKLQKWVNENFIIPSHKLGLRQIAFVKSHNLFTDVSMRQAMEEHQVDIKFKFFDNITQARQWLNVS